MKKKHGIAIILLMGLGGLALSFEHRIILPQAATTIAPAVFDDCTALDKSTTVINQSDCNSSNGSITGLKGMGTGALVFTWYDVSGSIAGTQAELLNVPAGTYTVKLRDDSKCPAATATFTITDFNPVKIDLNSAVIKSPTCNAVDGSITNIAVTAATAYKWVNVQDPNVVIATTKDLTGVAPGTYKFTASNAKGCMAFAQYTINPGSFAPIMTAYQTTDSGCGASGEFTATFDMKPTDQFFTYTITNSKGKIVKDGAIGYTPGDSTRIKAMNLAADTYTLTSFGQPACFFPLVKFTIGLQAYEIDTSKVVIHTDVCGQGLGTIIGLGTKGGGIPNPDGIYWNDAKGNRIASRFFLLGKPAGKYTLYLVSPAGCTTPTVTFNIPDSISSASRPQLDDIKMCVAGRAKLSVSNRDYAARYLLYDSALNVIDSNRTGFFLHQVNITSVFYVGAVDGICVSPLGKVTVTIVNPGINIPNAFTPNNDGINDTWGVTGLDQYPGTEITVFDRSRQRVYYSLNYSIPFDGRINGRELSTGTYYYIIDTKKPGCTGGISGSLAIIR
jgi:gliding motility-associated-like protein